MTASTPPDLAEQGAGLDFDRGTGCFRLPLDTGACARQQAALQTSLQVARENQPSYPAVLVPADGRQGTSWSHAALSSGQEAGVAIA